MREKIDLILDEVIVGQKTHMEASDELCVLFNVICFKKNVSPTILIEYDTLQSQKGKAYIRENCHYFERLEVTGNKLILYKSDNGFTKNGRLGGVFDLNAHEISFM
jgi:hypothetical protein